MMFLEDSDDHANKVCRPPPPTPLNQMQCLKKQNKKKASFQNML